MAIQFKNPYESLRVKGIVGQVATNFESVNIFSVGDRSVSAYVGIIEPPDKWDYGFSIYPEAVRKVPGEGSGFFLSRSAAMLYALAELSNRFRKDKLVLAAINREIFNLINVRLF